VRATYAEEVAAVNVAHAVLLDRLTDDFHTAEAIAHAVLAALDRDTLRCKCGCGASLSHRRYGTVWSTEACAKRHKRATQRRNADVTPTQRRSYGAKIPYRRFTERLPLIGLSLSDRLAVERLALKCLPERQRPRAE
jgi:hypothetical protein